MDDVHDMMDDISEQNEIAQEIGDALSAPIGFNQELDEVKVAGKKSITVTICVIPKICGELKTHTHEEKTACRCTAY